MKYAIQNGIINESIITKLQNDVDMVKRKKYLSQHPNSIGQLKDGRWFTRIAIDGKKTKTIIKKNRIELENAIVELYKRQDENPTLKELFTSANDKKLERDQIKRNTYYRYIEMFDKYISDFGNCHIKDLTLDNYVEFIEDVFYKKHLDKKGYEKLRSVLNVILKEAFKQKYINFTLEQITMCLDISKKDISKNKRPETPQVYTQEEQQKIKNFCEASHDIRDKGILLEMSCGFRQGELTALRWEDYKGKYVNVSGQERREKDANGKYQIYVEHGAAKTENAIRMVPLSPLAIRTFNSLKEISGNSHYIFSYPDGKRIQSQAIYKRLKTVCKTLDIQYKSPHKLRKTFVSECINSNMPVQTIQKVVGHSEPNTTLRYYTFNTLKEDEISRFYEENKMLK